MRVKEHESEGLPSQAEVILRDAEAHSYTMARSIEKKKSQMRISRLEEGIKPSFDEESSNTTNTSIYSNIIN